MYNWSQRLQTWKYYMQKDRKSSNFVGIVLVTAAASFGLIFFFVQILKITDSMQQIGCGIISDKLKSLIATND